MPNIKLNDYYNRYDSGKNYDRVLMRATRTAQSAEQNEIQSIFEGKLRGIADALFKDGDIIRDARINYNAETGSAHCEAGLIYLAGAVRPVPEGDLVVPAEGSVAIGVFLDQEVITELEDPDLYNPAIGTRSEGEPGAARLRVSARWGLATDNLGGDFYPVHTVDEGQLQAKEAPPNLDSLTQALARYDRDSAGGTYVVSGLTVRIADDSEAGHQVYTVSEGRARVYGYPVELTTSRRLVYPTEPDLLEIKNEIHLALGQASQRLNLNRYPVRRVSRVSLTRETTETITHGGYTGASDPLPHTSVAKILEVKQGNVTFTVESDYKLTAGKIDWSPSGPEPSPHSTYTVKYQYIDIEYDPAADLSGLSVEGAVADTQIYVDYEQMLPRLDRLCLTREGTFIWVPGVASDWSPQKPPAADDLLPLATVCQTWDNQRRVANDGVRVVPMDEIAAINTRLDELTEHVAQQRLTADLFTREAGAKKGLFVDPFLSDNMRDQGLAQTGAIGLGVLTLPIAVEKVAAMPDDVDRARYLDYSPGTALEQLSRTGEMKVNPYSAFDPLPPIIKLSPAIDRWTEQETVWASEVTNIFNEGHYVPEFPGLTLAWSESTSATEQLGSQTNAAEYLRSIEVAFSLSGFGPGEALSMTFDGLPVTPSVDRADSAGNIEGSFTIPSGIPAGSKSVVFQGGFGSQGSAVFVGQGSITVQTLRTITNTVLFWHDPLAQTFALSETCQLCGVELWFTKKHTSRVIVQIRETTVGIPNQNVLGEAILNPADIRVDGSATRAVFNSPVTVGAETEYAIVIMCDDGVTSVAVAELGQWDFSHNRWVTSQPYQVGVLLSSSNASTWTPHQSHDLTFRLLKAVYSAFSAEIDLGEVAVESSTDLMLLPVAEQPSAQTRAEYRLTLPDHSVVTVSDRQGIRLGGPTAGPIRVRARLSGSGAASPVLHPGTQLICGAVRQSADYISRAVPAGPGSRVKVIIDADLPSGSGVRALAAADGADDWAELDFQSSRALDDGWQELTYETNTEALLVRVKLVLSGSSTARPRVDNLRVLTI